MKLVQIKSAVTVFLVKDIEQSINWYKQWLGLPMEGVAEYELSPGTWLQLSQAEEVTSSSLILGVEDAKECKQVLEQHHIETGELVDYEVVYVFDVLDPDNNQISFAQEV
mgnify:CR=1 FL=1